MKKKSNAEQLFFYKRAVKVPIYSGNFLIIFSNDLDRVCSLVNCNKEEVGYLYAYTFHRFIHKGWESWAVCLNFWAPYPITMGTIMHEITHAAHRILHSREVVPDFINDEAEAYLVAFLADEVYKFMQKCKLTQ